jgi:hephaestin
VLGPVIRGVVGDTLKVTFRNKLQEHNVSMHPHGVWYDKDSEGSPYNDGLPCEWGPDPGGGGGVRCIAYDQVLGRCET